jgi:diphthine-ammonia ligase
MKLGVLFSGGKDSTLAAWLAKKYGHELSCLITIESENKDSFMFHTPSIEKTRVQADASDIPLIIQKTKGEKEDELSDLRKAISQAKEEYAIEGVVTGALKVFIRQPVFKPFVMIWIWRCLIRCGKNHRLK